MPGRLGPGQRDVQRRQPGHRTSTSRPGETVTCTFTNQKRGSIVVVKDAQPNDAQDFAFTAGGGLSPASFQLDDDADAHAVEHADLHERRRRAAATRSSETVPARLGPRSSATCSDGSPVSNIDVGPGETVTCTFTNLKRGQIVVVKDAQPERPAGLQLHGRRRPQPHELPARRRRRPRRCSNTRTFTERAGRQRLLGLRDRARRAGT